MEVKCVSCGKVCNVRPSRAKGFKNCSMKCFGTYSKGHKAYNYKGGRTIRGGYVYVLNKGHPKCDPDGYVIEHRLIVERHLGRFLTKKEIVHHINGIRSDNRLENLELYNSQSQHIKGNHTRLGCRGFQKSLS